MGTIESLIDRLTQAAKAGQNRQRQNLLSIYRPELANTLRRVSEIKNLLYRQRAAQLRDIFVEPVLTDGRNDVESDAILASYLDGQKIVIRGSAGFGKSVLLKSLCLKHVDNNLALAPLFVELRKIEDADAGDLLNTLHSIYSKGSGDISKSDLSEILKERFFGVILDGFDEVNPDIRQRVESSILRFAMDYPACPLIVSGRHDQVFQSWEQFTIYDIRPMSEEGVISLISKLEYDEDLKGRFLSDAIPRLFDNKDRSFVQTPLLAILMLLTYELYAEVPEKMHLFYANAFETLLRGHDVTKSQFRRPLISNLTEEEFKRMFAAFCAITYSDKKFEFSFDEINSYINKALAATSVKGNVRLVIDDLVLSVCVMQYEGLEYSFVHRSFQEYFTAVYLRDSPLDVVSMFLEQGYHATIENVIPMLIGMDRDRLEAEWCLPTLARLKSEVDAPTKRERTMKFFARIYPIFGCTMRHGVMSSLTNPRSDALLKARALETIYPTKDMPIWWVDSWDAMLSRAVLIRQAIVEGRVDGSIGDRDDHDEEGNLGEELHLKLDAISYEDLVQLKLYQIADYFLSHLYFTYDEVKDRVDNRSAFSDMLFSKRENL